MSDDLKTKIVITADAQSAVTAVQGVDKSVQGLSESLNGLFLTAGASLGFTSLTESLIDAKTAAGEYDKALTEISTLSVEAAAHIGEYRQEILALSADTGQPLEKLTKGLYDSISAGVPAAEAMNFMASASALATAGVSDTAATVDLLTGVLNAYGKPASDAAMISDQLFATVQQGKTKIDDLAQSLGRVAPVMNAAGVSTAEMMAVTADLTTKLPNTAESITGLTALMASLARGNDNLAAAFKNQGYESAIAAIKAKGLGEALNILYKASGGTLDGMIKLIPEVTGANAALAAGANNAQGFTDKLKNINDSAGGVQEAAEKIGNSADNMAKKLAAAAHTAKVAFGEDLIKTFGKSNDTLREWLTTYATMDENLRSLTNQLALFSASSLASAVAIQKAIIPLWEYVTAQRAAATATAASEAAALAAARSMGGLGPSIAATTTAATVSTSAMLGLAAAIGFTGVEIYRAISEWRNWQLAEQGVRESLRKNADLLAENRQKIHDYALANVKTAGDVAHLDSLVKLGIITQKEATAAKEAAIKTLGKLSAATTDTATKSVEALALIDKKNKESTDTINKLTLDKYEYAKLKAWETYTEAVKANADEVSAKRAYSLSIKQIDAEKAKNSIEEAEKAAAKQKEIDTKLFAFLLAADGQYAAEQQKITDKNLQYSLDVAQQIADKQKDLAADLSATLEIYAHEDVTVVVGKLADITQAHINAGADATAAWQQFYSVVESKSSNTANKLELDWKTLSSSISDSISSGLAAALSGSFVDAGKAVDDFKKRVLDLVSQALVNWVAYTAGFIAESEARQAVIASETAGISLVATAIVTLATSMFTFGSSSASAWDMYTAGGESAIKQDAVGSLINDVNKFSDAVNSGFYEGASLILQQLDHITDTTNLVSQSFDLNTETGQRLAGQWGSLTGQAYDLGKAMESTTSAGAAQYSSFSGLNSQTSALTQNASQYALEMIKSGNVTNATTEASVSLMTSLSQESNVVGLGITKFQEFATAIYEADQRTRGLAQATEAMTLAETIFNSAGVYTLDQIKSTSDAYQTLTANTERQAEITQILADGTWGSDEALAALMEELLSLSSSSESAEAAITGVNTASDGTASSTADAATGVDALAASSANATDDVDALGASFDIAAGYAGDAASKVKDLNDEINKLQSKTITITTQVTDGSSGSSSTPDGSHAGGLDTVPFDGYIAETHKKEAILTASDANIYRDLKATGIWSKIKTNASYDTYNSSSAVSSQQTVNLGSVNITINTQPGQSPKEIGDAALAAILEASRRGKVVIYDKGIGRGL